MPVPTKTKGIFQRLRVGRNYMRTWPSENKRLSQVGIFAEIRIIRLTRFAIKVMPFMAAFSIAWKIAFETPLEMAIVVALFALCIPLQGLLWLAWRAESLLPITLINWYHELCGKLRKVGQTVEPVNELLTYNHLAVVLQQAIKQLDESFLGEI